MFNYFLTNFFFKENFVGSQLFISFKQIFIHNIYFGFLNFFHFILLIGLYYYEFELLNLFQNYFIIYFLIKLQINSN